MNIRHIVIGGLVVAIIGARFIPFGSMSTVQAADALKARAEERWKLRSAGDWIREYQFLTPQRRAVEPLDKYLVSKDNFGFFNVKIQKVEVKADGTGEVSVRYEWESRNPILVSLMKGSPLQPVDVVESWKWVDATDKDAANWYIADTKRAGGEDLPSMMPAHDLSGAQQPADLTSSPQLGGQGSSRGVQKSGSTSDTNAGGQKR
ncbi:MAG: hypothetical protein U1E76_27460 [Planctomycetota bacterium]